jgi:hypothetical protein
MENSMEWVTYILILGKLYDPEGRYEGEFVNG